MTTPTPVRGQPGPVLEQPAARSDSGVAVASPGSGLDHPGLPDTRERRHLAQALERHRHTLVAAWAASQFDADLLARYRVDGANEHQRATLLRGFIAPLLDLLIAYIRTGESRYKDVYLDERLRYAPFQAARETRVQFFRELLPADEDAMLQVLPARSPLRDQLHSLLSELHQPLLAAPSGARVRVLGLGDCLLNELRVFLPARCREGGIDLDLRGLYFSAVVDRALDVSEALRFIAAERVDLIALSFLTYAAIPAYHALLNQAESLGPAQVQEYVTGIVGLIHDFVTTLRASTDAPMLIHNASGLPLGRWRERIGFLPPLSAARWQMLDALNASIRELVDQTPNAILVDEMAVATGHGHRDCAQPVIPHRVARGGFFHVARFGEYLCEPYAQIVSSYRQLHKTKVLAIDFDGTLWGGVMADGTVEHYRDRQELLRRLKEGGILLVAVSKNDPTAIRWDEMALQPSDFVSQKVSWRLKIEALQECANELDLGLDSFVFIDDNPVERDLVRSQLPSVVTLDALDQGTWRSLEWMLQFPNTRQTAEARARTEMYRQQVARRSALNQQFDYPTLMAGLDLRATFGPARTGDLERLTELVQRTNQFNTTSMRYSRQELAALLTRDSHRIYVATLEDKFGALGIVAAALIERRDGDVIFNAFVMSCRAIGFQLERLVVRLVLDAEAEAQRFIGHLVPTDRNTPAMSLFRDCGFRMTEPNLWLLERSMPILERPGWFCVTVR